MKKEWKIYQLIFPNGKFYIGQTTRTIWKRFKEHCTDTSKRILRFAIRKYKKENIVVKLLDVSYTQEEADRVEDGYIMLFDTIIPSGYNMQRGGQHHRKKKNSCSLLKLRYSLCRIGIKPGEITRKKMSMSKLGKNNHFFGKQHTEESKRLISFKKSGVPNLLKRKVDPIDIETSNLAFKTRAEQAEYLGISRRPIYEYHKKNGNIKERQRRTTKEIESALDESYDPFITYKEFINNTKSILNIKCNKMIKTHMKKTSKIYTFYEL